MTTRDPALPTPEDGGGLASERDAREVIEAYERGSGTPWEDVRRVLREIVDRRCAALLSQARADGEREEWAVRFQTEGQEVYSHFNAVDEQQARRHAVGSGQRRAWVVRRTVTDWVEVPS